MNLPDICPKCKASFEDDASYVGYGIQYCNGSVLEFGVSDEDDSIVVLDLADAGDDWAVKPYSIRCSECNHELWKETIIINEEKFFEDIQNPVHDQ